MRFLIVYAYIKKLLAYSIFVVCLAVVLTLAVNIPISYSRPFGFYYSIVQAPNIYNSTDWDFNGAIYLGNLSFTWARDKYKYYPHPFNHLTRMGRDEFGPRLKLHSGQGGSWCFREVSKANGDLWADESWHGFALFRNNAQPRYQQFTARWLWDDWKPGELDNEAWYTSWNYKVPAWFAILIFAAFPLSITLRWLRRTRRSRLGICIRCGYNLAGNLSGICPECGTIIASPIVTKIGLIQHPGVCDQRTP